MVDRAFEDFTVKSCQHALRVRSASLLSPKFIHSHLIESSDIQFRAEICSMDVTSIECLSEVRSLLSCPSKVAAARDLKGNEAQMLVDFLDRVSGLCPSSSILMIECVERRFWSNRPSMTNFVNGVFCSFLRSAKPVVLYPPGMFFEGGYTWGRFTTTVGPQT